jgi:hypothetical protein
MPTVQIEFQPIEWRFPYPTIEDYNERFSLVECQPNIDKEVSKSDITRSEFFPTYAFPKFDEDLKHIECAIENSSSILHLEVGWDGNDAEPISHVVYDRAIGFLKNYSQRLQDIFNFTIDAPSIQPLNNGSIDLYWTNETAHFLVNFKNADNGAAYYYGEMLDNNGEKFDVNGQISATSIVDTFAAWLKHFPKMEN